MSSVTDLIWYDGKFLGITWTVWKIIGWAGNLVFFSRFFVQWYATEKKKQVVVPVAFWWLSLIGSLLLLVYGLQRKDSVIIFAYLFTWIPYIRNLVIHHRHANSHAICVSCETTLPSKANFCPQCGAPVKAQPVSVAK